MVQPTVKSRQPQTLADQIQHPLSNYSTNHEFLNEEQSEEPIGMFDLKLNGRQDFRNLGVDRTTGRTAIFQRNRGF
jgi:hypothetical protein